jgi:hypothetical protein
VVKNKYEATQDEYDYLEAVNDLPDDSEKVIPWYKSAPRTILKGAIEGVSALGRAMGPIPTQESTQELLKKQTQQLDEAIPSNEGVIEGGLRRILKNAPINMAFPGSATAGIAARTAVGGLLGEGASQLGAPEWMQTVAEIAPLLTPSIGSRIQTVPGSEQEQLAEFGRRMGLAEEDLALSLGNRGAIRDTAEELSSKGGRTARAFDRTRDALSRVWNTLSGSPEAQTELTGAQSSNLINRLSRRLQNIPAEARNRIEQDFNDLLASDMRGTDVINFWQDLNYYISRGERGLGVLKEDLQLALNQISPALGSDFNLTNRLYGNFSQQAERMGPNIADRLITAGESGLVLSAITTGNFPLLKKIIGPLAGRKLAAEMVINPRFQNLSAKFINSLNQGRYAVSEKIYNQIVREVGKSNAEAAMKLSDLDFDEFAKSLSSKDKP